MAKSARRKSEIKTKPEICLQCGEEVEIGLRHCAGSKVAFGGKTPTPHHGKVLWGPCWRCSTAMGCSACLPGKRDQNGTIFNDELICKRCRVKANLESMLNGGPISRFTFDFGREGPSFGKINKYTPGLEEYPFEWRAKYAAQRLRRGMPLDLSDEEAFEGLRLEIRKLLETTEMPQELSKRQRQAERNRQVAALAGATN